MNADTGQVYRELEEIAAAQERGEPLVMVSDEVADAVEIGMEALSRARRRYIERKMEKRNRRR